MLLDSACAACQTPGPPWCRRCRMALLALPQVRVHTALGGPAIRAALPFDGIARSIVTALKYRNRRGGGELLAEVIVRRLFSQGRASAVDVVTWAPTTRQRAGRRGFDQAELLARQVARRLGVPCRRLLYREHRSAGDRPQTGASRLQRLLGPHFRARRPPAALRVVVVDDVVTTGATLCAAAEALRVAGFGHVDLVAATAARPEALEVPVWNRPA